MTLVVVLSGFIGRYLMSVIGREIREKKEMLGELETDYEIAVGELRGADRLHLLRGAGPVRATVVRVFAPLFSKLRRSCGDRGGAAGRRDRRCRVCDAYPPDLQTKLLEVAEAAHLHLGRALSADCPSHILRVVFWNSMAHLKKILTTVAIVVAVAVGFFALLREEASGLGVVSNPGPLSTGPCSSCR